MARAAGTLDFSRPVAITLLMILHVIKDPYALTSGLLRAVTLFTHAEATRFFDGLELLEPGIVPVNHWRPGTGGPDPAGEPAAYAGTSRDPAPLTWQPERGA